MAGILIEHYQTKIIRRSWSLELFQNLSAKTIAEAVSKIPETACLVSINDKELEHKTVLYFEEENEIEPTELK